VVASGNGIDSLAGSVLRLQALTMLLIVKCEPPTGLHEPGPLSVVPSSDSRGSTAFATMPRPAPQRLLPLSALQTCCAVTLRRSGLHSTRHNLNRIGIKSNAVPRVDRNIPSLRRLDDDAVNQEPN
jgi:hypothetical protein